MVPVVDHVGIAVRSLEEAVPLYRALFGEQAQGQEVVSSEGVRVAFFGEGSGRIELLEPTHADSPVGRFLGRRGPGLHHICLRVVDLEAAITLAETRGAQLLPPGIRTGSEGRRVAFLHPGSTGGVLLELAEGSIGR